MFAWFARRRRLRELRKQREWRSVRRREATTSYHRDRAWAAYDKMQPSYEKRQILSMLTIGQSVRPLSAEDYRDIADGCEKIVAVEQRWKGGE